MLRRFILFTLPALLVLMTGCSLKEYTLFQEENASDEPTKVSDEVYKDEMIFENKIVPNDRISVTIFNQSGSGGQITSLLNNNQNGGAQPGRNGDDAGLLVSTRGTVHLPLVGTQKVTGMTEYEAEQYLMTAYQKYLKNPYVHVKLLNQRIYMLGEIASPGVVQVTNGTMNLVEAIARQGDLTDYANRLDIKIIRGDLRKPEIRTVDLTQMSAISMSSLYLKPNDIVYIPPRGIKGWNIAFQQITPAFSFFATLLQPFVNITFLIKALE